MARRKGNRPEAWYRREENVARLADGASTQSAACTSRTVDGSPGSLRTSRLQGTDARAADGTIASGNGPAAVFSLARSPESNA